VTVAVTPTTSVDGGYEPTSITSDLAAQLQSVLDSQRKLRHIPGVAAAIIFPDGSIWKAGSGRAQITPRELATARIPFVVASITKTFVTAAVMQLADEGKLSIDDVLSKWLPDYPDSDNITLRELLGHTSGVFNYLQAPNFNRLVFKTGQGHYWTPQEILDTFAEPPYFAPGDGFHYSNTGFILLGLVIEQVTGQKLGDVFAQRFFGPLGLTDTYFQGSGPLPPTAAQGYGYTNAVWNEWSDGSDYRPGVSGATVSWSAGAIASSARDIAKWCAALYGGHVVSAKSLAEMETYTHYYGLGTWTRTHNGRRMFGHIGSFHGFDAAMWYYPTTRLTVVVLTNLANISANPIADALADVAQP
jgi:D-alanyl-D-alanine carboxypeptidase